MKSFTALLILVFCAFAPLQAKAADPMMFPLACDDAGRACFIIGYPDVDQSPDVARDFACGPATSEADPFLRIGLPDVGTLTLGALVVASDAGKVIDATDGLPDLVASSKSQIKKGTPVCGNGIVIDHGLGKSTVYCHLKQGSVRVQTGDMVTKGQVIGAAGQSGVALWPQLGFSIQQNGYAIDPMTGSSPAEGCGFKPRAVLDLPDGFKEYQPVAITNLGFSTLTQTEQAIALGKVIRLVQINPASQALTLWGMVVGVKKDDVVETVLKDGRGRIFHQQKLTMDKDNARQLINFTRQRGYAYWRVGTYSGTITVTRTIDGKPYTVTRSTSVLIE